MVPKSLHMLYIYIHIGQKVKVYILYQYICIYLSIRRLAYINI